MSISGEVERLAEARDTIRTKLVALGLSASTDKLDALAADINGITNQGAKTASLNAGGSYTIPKGYHNGSGKVTANSLSSQTSGTAAAGDILSGKTAWVGGSKITGTISSKAASTYGAKSTAQTIAAGQYLSGAQTIAAVTQTNLAADNIIKGVTVTVASNGSNIFSVTGTRELPSATTATAATFQMNYTGGYSYKAATSCAAYGSATKSSTAGYVTLPAGTYRVIGFGYVDGDSNSKGFWISKQGAVSSNLVKGSVMNSSNAHEFVIDTTLTLTASTTVTLVMYSSETGYGRRGAASIFRVS